MPEDSEAKSMFKYRERILSGPVIRTTLWLAWPIIIANIVNISYNLVDTFWLGKLGKEALSAPTVSWPMIMLLYSIGMGLSFAGVTLVSQYVGAGEKEYARKTAGYMIGFMLLLAVTISGIGYVLAPSILKAMQVPEEVLPLAVSYIRVIFTGIPIAFIGFAFISILNGIGDTRTPTIIGIISSLVNVVLDPIMIFGWFGLPPMGVIGAAIATVLSRAIVSAIGIFLLIRGYMGLKIRFNDLFFELWWLRKVLKIGIPLAIQQSANSLGFVIMMSIVASMGTTVIATYGIGIRIIDIIQAFTWGLMRATSIMIGQTIGAENYSKAEEIVRKSMMLIFGVLVIGALMIFIFRRQLYAVFIDDPGVLAEGDRFLSIFVPSIPFFGLFFVAGAVARGSGHTVAYTIISIIRLWLLRIGLTIILAYFVGLGSIGVWIAMSISNIGAGIIATLWVMRGTWKQRVIEIPGKPRVQAGIGSK